MATREIARVTVSLPQKLLELADQLAQEWSTSRSGAIAELLEKEERARLEALMEEGYRELAEENRRFAEEIYPAVSEMTLRATEWAEPPDD
ncbi:MAG: CopG family transcriptional regulator / antitoxin EndoAI [Chloroflexi bacterium]|jgi:CopG family transcriptional regulator/antitoxin EndoAI|nr:MAG: CopG family transcriptional regulator / antitoxin EndoAI [Chloroflexota bacterium]